MRQWWSESGPAGADVLYPVCLLPKRLYYDFDLTVDGKSVPLVNHEVDVAYGVQALVERGIRANHGTSPPAPVLDYLGAVVGAFPWAMDEATDSSSNPAREICEVGVVAATTPFDDQDSLTWWTTAIASPEWVELAEDLAHNFILLVSLDPDLDRVLVKTKAVEPAHAVSGLKAGALEFSAEIEFHGCGRALSEHFRMTAPERMFFSGDYVSILDRAYLKQESKSRLNYYFTHLPRRELVVWATLSPDQRSFAVPAAVIAGVSFAVLTVGGVFDGVLNDLAGKSTAVGAMALFLPSAAVAYLNRGDDHELRWRALAYVRRLAWAGLVPLLAGFVTLTPPPEVWPADFVTYAWRLLAVVAGLILVLLAIPILTLRQDEETKSKREGTLIELTIAPAT